MPLFASSHSAQVQTRYCSTRAAVWKQTEHHNVALQLKIAIITPRGSDLSPSGNTFSLPLEDNVLVVYLLVKLKNNQM